MLYLLWKCICNPVLEYAITYVTNSLTLTTISHDLKICVTPSRQTFFLPSWRTGCGESWHSSPPHSHFQRPYHHVTSQVALCTVSIPGGGGEKRHGRQRHMEGLCGPGLGGAAHHFLSHSVVQNPVLWPHLTGKGSRKYSPLAGSHFSDNSILWKGSMHHESLAICCCQV